MLAAAAFLELRQIWVPLDPETSSKVKYAKYHALRIAKAIKAGEDPNLTNPAQESVPSPEISVAPHSSDVQMTDDHSSQRAAYQPSIEEVPDGHDPSDAYRSQKLAADGSQLPSRAPPLSPQLGHASSIPAEIAPSSDDVENFYQRPSVPDVSPLQSPDRGRNGSVGSGYFPRAPGTDRNHEQNTMDNVHGNGLDLSSPPNLPDSSSLPPPSSIPSQDPPSTPAGAFPSDPLPSINPNYASRVSASAAGFGHQQSKPPPVEPSRYPQPMASSEIPPRQASFSQSLQHSSVPPAVVDEEALAKAQKHARWAISALNFEDVNTAIKELRSALESLGAR